MNKATLIHEDFNPIESATLIKTRDLKSFNSTQIKALYEESQLTQEEFVVLDFLAAIGLIKHGEFTVSFQGLKRKFDLHQAKLTKALKRLLEKDLLIKEEKGGYTLTKNGMLVAQELTRKYGRQDTLEKTIHSHVAFGEIQGMHITADELAKIADYLSGRWFGDYRFLTKSKYEDVFEIEWISTTGSICAKAVFGPHNKTKVIISSAKIIYSEIELQMMMERISTTVERLIDATVVFQNRAVFVNTEKLPADEIPSTFAS